MNQPLPVRHSVLEDPYFIALAVISLLFVCYILANEGTWRYLTGALVGILNFAIAIVWFYCIALTVVEFIQAVYGPHGRRGVSLTWAIIMSAFSLIIPLIAGYANSTETRIGRFLAFCKPPKYR